MDKGQLLSASGALEIGGGWAFDENGIARKLESGWAFDYAGLARRIFSSETPLVVNYTGTYTDEIVQMTDGTYRLLTLTGSGTLTFNQQVECDIWLCGGGASGQKAGGTLPSSSAGGGGGGGYCKTLFNQVVQNVVVDIGAGGADETEGSATILTGDVVDTADGGGVPYGTGSNRRGGDGGSGGGAPGKGDAKGGLGSGITTRPFQDASQTPYCSGGGGGAQRSQWGSPVLGGDGGSNGSDGLNGNNASGADGIAIGGYYGGGDGARRDDTAAVVAEDGFSHGGGGGGGSNYSGYINAGAGYQGCVMVRVKLNDEGLPQIPFTINGTSYTADNGMTWAQWVASSYNTGGFFIDKEKVFARIGYYDQAVKYNNVYVTPADLIVFNGVYIAGTG